MSKAKAKAKIKAHKLSQFKSAERHRTEKEALIKYLSKPTPEPEQEIIQLRKTLTKIHTVLKSAGLNPGGTTDRALTALRESASSTKDVPELFSRSPSDMTLLLTWLKEVRRRHPKQKYVYFKALQEHFTVFESCTL
jgi:hypothetical protein